MEGNPDSRGHQMTGRLTEEAAELLRRTEQGGQPTATTAIQHNYSGPVSQVDLTNATNVSVSVGEQGARGCLSQERYCQKLDLLKEYFVDIHTLQTAQQLLEKQGYVSICGAPGDGKTSIALKICEAYQQKGYEAVFVENIERFDIDTLSKRQSHMLVVFDDIFGSVTFSSNLEKLHELFSALVDDLTKTAADKERDSKKKKDKQSKAKEQSNEETPIYRLKLVYTSRTYIWKEGCSRLHQYKVDLLKTEAVLDMTKDHLTVEEKKRMLRSFKSKHPKCDISEKDICSITDSKNNIFGFPLISRLFFTNPVFQMHNVKFFINPLTYLRGDLDAIVREESNRSAAILLLILCDGNLNLVSLQSRKSGNVKFDAVKDLVPCCTSIGVAKEITNFTGVYCTVEDHIASFSHPSIYDAAACAVGHLNIVMLLEHCSLKFLYERVRLGKSIQSSDIDDVSNMIYITPQLHQTVVDRLVEGIRQGCFIWTVKHPVLREERIAALLWTEINDNIVEIVKQKDRDSGECFLYLASLSESYFLFSKSLEVVGSQGDTSTDLYDCVVACVTHGKLKNLEHLVTVMSLQAGFNVEFSIRGTTLLIMAAQSGQSEVFNFLIQKGADISVTDRTGNTCLHYACESGSMALTRKVVEMCPVLLNSKSFVGFTPAMLCAKAGHLLILKFLKQKGAHLSLTDCNLLDCLHLASENGNLSTVRFLISLKMFNVNKKETFLMQTSAMKALEGGHYDVYDLLVSEGADLTLTDYKNRDCLMLACEGGNIHIVKHVLSMKTCDINRRGGFFEQTPIMMALEDGHYDVYHLLVSEGADLTLLDKNKSDCLMLACVGGNINIVKHVLLMKTCDINRRGQRWKQTPIMMALEEGHDDVYHLLVSEGADLTLTDDNNRDCLMLACERGNINIVKHVLSVKTCDINRRGGELKQTPIMMALERGHDDVYHLLVSEGADLTLTDDNNRDCLMLAFAGGNINIVKHVLSMKTCDINRRGGELKQTPIMMALEEGHDDVYHLLVSEGADLTLTDVNNRDCLMMAFEGGNMNIVKHVLSMKTCDINRQGGDFEQTPVMMALEGGHDDVYHLLVSEGADLTLTDEYNRDCLMLACEGGNTNIVKHVLSMKTCDINRQGGELKQTPIMMALEGGHYDVYHLLVSEGADLTLTDDDNRDCLMLAYVGGNINIVKHVLSMKTCDINGRGGRLKQTPIMMALEEGHYAFYHLLVSEGADLTLTDDNSRDCLMLACVGGNISIVKHVLSMKTCDINRQGGRLTQTPIMMALEEGHYDIYHLLVSEGADLTLTDDNNRDCLMLAFEGGNINIVKHVLSMKTCDINRQGGELKQTPIMMALEGEHYDVYHLLISEGADTTLTDDDNRDCLMLACERGNMNIVKHVLSMKTCDINRQGGELKQTPIMMALEGEHYDVYHLLVSEGADTTLTDDNNRDCLMLACVGGNISIVKHVLSMKTCDINRRGQRWKQTPIMMALEGGHDDIYHLLVSEGADLTLTDYKNRDCLILACVGGNINIVKHVLSMKTCDINRQGGELKQTPIMMALEEGHYDVYHILVSEGADLTLTDYKNRDCLMLACVGGNIHIVEHVLSMKTCDINRQGGWVEQTPIMMALEEGHDDVYHLLVSEGADLTLTDDNNRDCLMLACKRGNMNIVKHVLSMKTCDINRQGGELKQTPVMMALEEGHYFVYDLLVSEGADLTLTDDNNRDCLMLAFEGGNINIVKHVLSMKTCDINRRGGELKQTPIMMALEGGNYDVYHLLVSEGADLTLTDDDNRDCLMLACVGGNINIVKHVLSMKTWDINRRGGELKQTPIMMALEEGHDDVYHLLVSEGADTTLTDDDNTD